MLKHFSLRPRILRVLLPLEVLVRVAADVREPGLLADLPLRRGEPLSAIAVEATRAVTARVGSPSRGPRT